MRWRDYQENVAEFFRQLDCDAEVEAKVQGARAKHKIDVWVTFCRFGLEQKWAIECKQYKRSVPKEKVLTLKGVIDDVGADRGVLVTESGFQPSARTAASSTNIALLTFAELRERAKKDLLTHVLGKLEERTVLLSESLHDLFWPASESWYSKLRPGVDEEGYYVMAGKLAVVERGLKRGKLDRFPTVIGANASPGDELIIAQDLQDLVERAAQILEEVEKWGEAQAAAIQNLEQQGKT